MNGEAYGIVLRTGDSTMLGQIANMAGSEKKRPSPMTQEINHFVFTIATVAFFFAIIFFGIGWSRLSGIPGATVGKIFSMDLNFAIGVFISFVPEGLPATMSVGGLALYEFKRFIN
jgi:sodium/potassium-transporting ATPase subunit alpha